MMGISSKCRSGCFNSSVTCTPSRRCQQAQQQQGRGLPHPLSARVPNGEQATAICGLSAANTPPTPG
jgi:hypothetical protein